MTWVTWKFKHRIHNANPVLHKEVHIRTNCYISSMSHLSCRHSPTRKAIIKDKKQLPFHLMAELGSATRPLTLPVVLWTFTPGVTITLVTTVLEVGPVVTTVNSGEGAVPLLWPWSCSPPLFSDGVMVGWPVELLVNNNYKKLCETLHIVFQGSNPI